MSTRASFSLSQEEGLLRQLQQQPHTTTVVVDDAGAPIGVWVASAYLAYEPIASLGKHMLEEALILASMAPEAPGPSAYQLRPGLWVDLEGYEVLRGPIRQRLKVREVEILRILLQQPRCYVSVEKLIRMTRLRHASNPKRSLQELISELRQKLGEEPRRPWLLRCQEGKSYAIFPAQRRQ